MFLCCPSPILLAMIVWRLLLLHHESSVALGEKRREERVRAACHCQVGNRKGLPGTERGSESDCEWAPARVRRVGDGACGDGMSSEAGQARGHGHLLLSLASVRCDWNQLSQHAPTPH